MRLTLAIFAACFSLLANAADCENSVAGQICKIKIEALHPTQFNIGQREVNQRAEKFAAMSDKKLKKYIRAHPAPIVIGPNQGIYLVDHHHLARALAQIGVQKIKAKVLEDFSKLSSRDFWPRMQERGWVLLSDKGVGPLSPLSLPRSITDMTDDPYRSLAWAVNSRHGYADSDIPYADFYWADFFRTRVDLSNFKQALHQAMDLAKSEEARGLPGYTPGR